MASNALANAAAAVSAGYIKTNTDRGVASPGAGGAPTFPASERYQTIFSKILAGASGEPGIECRCIGLGDTQNNAEINALANLNSWRANRYGADSASASAANTTPAIKDAASASKRHTKDAT
jgi:hypothetical protein